MQSSVRILSIFLLEEWLKEKECKPFTLDPTGVLGWILVDEAVGVSDRLLYENNVKRSRTCGLSSG